MSSKHKSLNPGTLSPYNRLDIVVTWQKSKEKKHTHIFVSKICIKNNWTGIGKYLYTEFCATKGWMAAKVQKLFQHRFCWKLKCCLHLIYISLLLFSIKSLSLFLCSCLKNSLLADYKQRINQNKCYKLKISKLNVIQCSLVFISLCRDAQLAQLSRLLARLSLAYY